MKEFYSYVDLLDEQFIQSSSELFAEFYRELQKKNSPEGIEADTSFEFRLLEYGRQRASALDELGYLDALVADKPVTDEVHLATRLSFELGYAAAEHHVMTVYEDYLHAGVARCPSGGMLAFRKLVRNASGKAIAHGKRY